MKLRDSLMGGIKSIHMGIAGYAAGERFPAMDIDEVEDKPGTQAKLCAGREHVQIIGHIVHELLFLPPIRQATFI